MYKWRVWMCTLQKMGEKCKKKIKIQKWYNSKIQNRDFNLSLYITF
jgi:hypothetical protein